jgi:hypothetical protein
LKQQDKGTYNERTQEKKREQGEQVQKQGKSQTRRGKKEKDASKQRRETDPHNLFSKQIALVEEENHRGVGEPLGVALLLEHVQRFSETVLRFVFK